MIKVTLFSLIPGAGHLAMGLSGDGYVYFFAILFFYFLSWPIGLCLHLFSIAAAAAEASQRPWLR